ncbi:hypothetical protein CN923_22075 [Bacillus cereus]|uniref:hypothetical protein n=1 Tax=Bacillus nitratireducens TaxID=2026193 RepID=UPI000BEC13F0|nr:hypothetical protein CON44_08740 [Bacillus cereus]PEX97947.1 hypothetical protein CN465_01335 [Bacillus cereus]PFK29007.1 hypothetical protein COJ05_03505 [Bacillus cereus]PFP56591.1 hypothetical protein COK09_18925 [Bacillus cereus]PFV23727.1 hypothetical protein COK97_08115 [Bacillus cereus]
MLTMREAIIEIIGLEWGIDLEKDNLTIDNLKSKIEEMVLEKTKGIVAFHKDISYEYVTTDLISEQEYDEAINEQEFRHLKINDIANLVIESYPNFDFKHVYSIVHKVVSTSNDFLLKSSPGYFEINVTQLSFSGLKRKLSKTPQFKAFQEALDDTQNQLNVIFNLIESETSDLIIKDSDRGMLAEQLELITKAVNVMKVYRMNQKIVNDL